MNNKEAIVWLKNIIDTFNGNCTTDTLVPISRCDVKALDLAIKALEKEARREERAAKEKAEKEKIEAHAVLYKDLKEGELFRITSKLNDKRIFRKDREGSTEIKDVNGTYCNYQLYPYLTMKVYKLE